MFRFSFRIFLLTLSLIFLFSAPAQAAVTDAEIQALIDGAQRYLKANQAADGSWDDSYQSGQELAATAFAVMALMETGVDKTDSSIVNGINYIKGFVQADGGIYSAGDESTSNYNNSVCLMALSMYGDKSDAFKSIIQNSVNFTLSIQNDSDDAYDGGWTYRPTSSGGWSEGDMSNTQFAIMGLRYGYRYLGLSPSGKAWAEAAKTFILRCHGWDDPANNQTWNDQDWADGKNVLGTDGAFSYKPDYSDFYPGGSMTAAGMWSLALIGQDQHPAVGIAQEWFKNNYTWDRNPGSYYDYSPDTALYYYVYAMSKALAATLGEQNLGANDWIQDLKDSMAAKVNTVADIVPAQYYWFGGGWLDGGEILATSWVLISLALSSDAVEAPEAFLPDEGLDNPIKGLVTLTTEGDVTISSADRGAISDATKPDTVYLPIGSFSFVLNNVSVGGTAKLTIEPPAEAFDEGNANGFIQADGTVKGALGWFKIENGQWKNQADVPISVDVTARTITVTLTDGGPEDADGAANGTIVDPGAPGGDTTDGGGGDDGGGGGGGGGGGCFLNRAF